jgi:DNA-binding response OmpR family regulator
MPAATQRSQNVAFAGRVLLLGFPDAAARRLTNALTSPGYAVSGRSVTPNHGAIGFDAVVVDARNDMLAGAHQIESVRQLTKGHPVVVIARDGEPGAYQLARRAGADVVLYSPVSTTQLVEVLDGLLGRQLTA